MPTLDKIPSEKLVKLVVRSVYEGSDTAPGGTTVQGISNLRIGTPTGGWSCTAVIESNGQEETLLVTYDGDRYSDVVQGAGDGEGAIALDAADDSPRLTTIWQKGDRTDDGVVTEVFRRRVQRTIDGVKIICNGRPDNPALMIGQGDAKVLKLASDVQRGAVLATKGGTLPKPQPL